MAESTIKSAMFRRDFLLSAAASAALPESSAAARWDAGSVRHLLPTASERRILLKASVAKPLEGATLRISGRGVPGVRTDTAGQFWRFDATGLDPDHTYQLELADSAGRGLCDPWPLRTFPEPDSAPRGFRVLIYTCAGGDERLVTPKGERSFLPLSVRGRLFDRALTYRPDAMVANGDHIYWDLRQTGAPPRLQQEVVGATGRFARSIPVLGTRNEEVLKRVCDQQILKLYGTRFRSVPVFFLQDDHDYFENDDADARMVTFPPDHFMLQLGRGTRRMCFPEFLPDANRPPGLAGSSAPDTPQGVSESYGTIRYGKLAEILLFDCRRYLTLAGPNATIVPPETEEWLKSRIADRAVAHVVNLSSMPPVWSAGKWGDWYPDILNAQGELTDKVEKPYWQAGWKSQHDRLMQALSESRTHIPMWISGDMHAHGEARVLRSGNADFRKNPVHCFLSGALGTGNGWPSIGRRTKPYPSVTIEAEEALPALEENGFILADFTEDKITIRFFRWLPKMGEDAIDRLEPFRTTELTRPG